jgi:hypothetical protein
LWKAAGRVGSVKGSPLLPDVPKSVAP